jgi:hypothetical protein
MKKAYLVTFSVRTRVIAENNDHAMTKAKAKILANAEEYIIQENLEDIVPDEECPFGTFLNDLRVN